MTSPDQILTDDQMVAVFAASHCIAPEWRFRLEAMTKGPSTESAPLVRSNPISVPILISILISDADRPRFRMPTDADLSMPTLVPIRMPTWSRCRPGRSRACCDQSGLYPQ